jgi:CRP-like cAMP-binding protein
MNDINHWFENVGHTLTLEKGEILFLRGDATRGPFILGQGQVRLYRQDRTGSEVTLHRVRPGEHFAEASIFSETYHCDCIADEKSTVLAIPRADIIEAIESQPTFASGLAEILAKQVMSLRTQLELRNIRSAEERILAALHFKAGEPARPFELKGTLKAFAAEIGLTHEALYRCLRKLQEDGRLRRHRQSIEVL